MFVSIFEVPLHMLSYLLAHFLMAEVEYFSLILISCALVMVIVESVNRCMLKNGKRLGNVSSNYARCRSSKSLGWVADEGSVRFPLGRNL